jgi:hypothetical protein
VDACDVVLQNFPFHVVFLFHGNWRRPAVTDDPPLEMCSLVEESLQFIDVGWGIECGFGSLALGELVSN